MKKGGYIVTFLVVSLLVVACGSYKSDQQAAKLTFPDLGSIVHTKGELWDITAEQIGKPNWATPLVINAQQLPFNKKTYVTYASYMSNAGRINGIAYKDSLPFRPKYIRLQLLDKIGLTGALNNDANTEVKRYLENDEAYMLVTRIDITVPDAMMPEFLGANKILLVEDEELGKHLVLTRGIVESRINLADVQIFDYGISSFCWGENRAHHRQIEAILGENDKCPKGTYSNASKVESDKSYLKF